MTKLQPGDRCEIRRKTRLNWEPATVLTVYPGHGGIMAITDAAGTADKAEWFQANAYRPLLRKYKVDEPVLVRTRAHGPWVPGVYHGSVIDTNEQHLVTVNGFADKYHHTNVMPATTTTPDPHGTAYQGEVGDHQPGIVTHDGTISEVTIEVEPKIKGILLKTRNHPRIEAEQRANNARRDESLHLITAMYRGAW